MIVKPRIKGLMCATSHPSGCAMDVQRQVEYVVEQGQISNGPARVLIIGASGGYGLATRISAAFGCNAETIGVFFERAASSKYTASPGWYKSAAFAEQAAEKDLYAKNINGDAYSEEVKQAAISLIKEDLGQVDMVVYSLAAPARKLSDGSIVRGTLKPIGEPYDGMTININSGELRAISLEPASPEEVADTVKVMGGEDWERWIAVMLEAGVLADGCITTNYTYLGSEVTWPIYYQGTIGKAKEDLDRAALALKEPMSQIGGEAKVVVMKGVLTQAASAIPGMPIYLSLLFKAMKKAGTHEGCIEQTTRLFATRLFSPGSPGTDDEGRIRMDDLELADDIQAYIKDNWSDVNTMTLSDVADVAGYRQAFMELYGFGFDGVDYEADMNTEWEMELVPSD